MKNADNPTTPTPTPVVVLPPLGPLIGQLLLGFISSPWLRAIITAILSAFGTIQLMSYPGCAPPPPPPPPPDKKDPPPIKEPPLAIGRIQFGSAGCTATIIGPVGAGDPKLHILTAAHCVNLGSIGTMSLKDGRKLGVTCVSRDPQSDAAWLTAIRPAGAVPWLLLADKNPEEGETVWHQGYGIDKPNSHESGKVLGITSGGQQCRFRLSVSPGDSGGGIILDANSRVISPVCCTTRLSGVGEVFGASPLLSAKIRPKTTTDDKTPFLIHPMTPHPVFKERFFPAPPPIG